MKNKKDKEDNKDKVPEVKTRKKHTTINQGKGGWGKGGQGARDRDARGQGERDPPQGGSMRASCSCWNSTNFVEAGVCDKKAYLIVQVRLFEKVTGVELITRSSWSLYFNTNTFLQKG